MPEISEPFFQFPEALTFNDVLLKPKFSSIVSRKRVNISSKFSANFDLNIPIVSANMDTVTESKMAITMGKLGGLGIIHRFMRIDDQAAQVALVKKQGVKVGAAVGAVSDYLDRCDRLLKAGVDVLVVDVAHGHSAHVLKAVKKIKKNWPGAEVVAGNVATAEGAVALMDAGADGIKVGVGPGRVCSTRIITGHGVPQLSAILDAARAEIYRKKPIIIADGGITNSGDIVKALAAGASCVMIGSLLAGSDECPGFTTSRRGIKYKVYRGMASLGANISKKQKEEKISMTENEMAEIVPEGIETIIPCRGKAEEVIKQLVGGIKSGLSYSGAENIEELQKRAKFIRITSAGWDESLPKE